MFTTTERIVFRIAVAGLPLHHRDPIQPNAGGKVDEPLLVDSIRAHSADSSGIGMEVGRTSNTPNRPRDAIRSRAASNTTAGQRNGTIRYQGSALR